MSHATLGISETVPLADETVTLPLHTTLQDDLDPHVEEASLCSVLYHLMWYAS
jgi:hypothetical protein